MIKKEKIICYLVNFNVSLKHCENQRKQKQRQVFRHCQRSMKAEEHESDGDTNCSWRNSQRLGKGTGRVTKKRTNRDNPKYSMVDIDQNTEKRTEDQMRFAVTQTPVKDHHLTLV